MTLRPHMNATDYLMSVFDHVLKQRGFSGNISQICIKLPSCPDLTLVRKAVTEMAAAFPIISAKQKRRFLSRLPYWALPGSPHRIRPPSVNHLSVCDSKENSMHAACEQFLNTPLNSKKGELIRLTLIEGDEHTTLIMSWVHALMDAHGAETFLAMVGDAEFRHAIIDSHDLSDLVTRRVFPDQHWRSEMKKGLLAKEWLDNVGSPPPCSIYTARAEKIQPKQVTRFIRFDEQETIQIKKSSSELSGCLGETNYYLAMSLMQLCQFHLESNIPAENFVVNVPFDARDKGSVSPIFSNFSSFVPYHLTREHLADPRAAIEALQQQTRESLRREMGYTFDCFAKLVRIVPPGLYWDRMKTALNDEIASMFFANIGKTPTHLSEFFGQKVLRLHHASSVTTPPGIGLFFHAFDAHLCCSLVLIDGLLTEDEIAKLIERIRTGLLHPQPTEEAK